MIDYCVEMRCLRMKLATLSLSLYQFWFDVSATEIATKTQINLMLCSEIYFLSFDRLWKGENCPGSIWDRNEKWATNYHFDWKYRTDGTIYCNDCGWFDWLNDSNIYMAHGRHFAVSFLFTTSYFREYIFFVLTWKTMCIVSVTINSIGTHSGPMEMEVFW